MEQKKISLSTIKPNKANPRVIKDSKFHKLVNSILVFPKMMEARPIVVNNEMVVLGGNMRLKALEVIKTMNEAEIRSRLGNLTDFTLKPKKEQEALVSEWLKWQDKPETFVVNAKEFTDAEQRQFIVKDNASFGEWDFDALKELYSTDFLSEMSIDIPAIQSDINMDDFFYGVVSISSSLDFSQPGHVVGVQVLAGVLAQDLAGHWGKHAGLALAHFRYGL